MYVLTCQMKAPVSSREAFAVFESPYNLARITPPWLRFRITTPGKVAMRSGAEIEYQIRWLGFPVSWKTIITDTTLREFSRTSRHAARTHCGVIATRSKRSAGHHYFGSSGVCAAAWRPRKDHARLIVRRPTTRDL